MAPSICGALCLLCNGMPVMEGMKEAYIGEAAGFFKTWFLFFLAGAILGKIMERSGAAASIARFIIDKCGTGMAIPAVVIACGVLMMGGVSGFVVVFTLAPLSVELFRAADIPRQYILPTIAMGNVMKTLMAGADGATTNMVGVAMIVAFAGTFKSTPNFQLVVDALLDLPFPPLVSAAIAVNVLCGITASAGGGLQVALPVIAQPYLDLGVNAVALHRVTAISCGVLDSMPHSALLNATLEATQLTQKETYKMFATICIGIAALTTVLAIVLFSVFPVLCNF